MNKWKFKILSLDCFYYCGTYLVVLPCTNFKVYWVS